MTPAVLDRHAAAAYVSLSTPTFEREVAAGRYPRPRETSKGSVGWRVVELDAAVEKLPVSTRLPGPGARGV